MRSLWALCLSLIVVLAAASGAAAAPSIVEFPLPATGGSPTDLATGADGNLWVSREGAINRVTLGGFATQFPLPDANALAQGITAGPDGRLWFAEFFKFNEFGRIALDGTFSMVPFAVPGQLGDFALGPDGNMWAAVPFGGTPRVTKFSPSGVVLADYNSGPERLPRRIVSGPSGALWLTESRDTQKFPDRVARITTSGALTEFIAPVSQFVNDIAVGPDGNLWTIETVDPTGPTLAVRTTPAGTRAQFDLAPGSNFGKIVLGPDANLWAALPQAGEIARIATNGAVDRYPLPTAGSAPSSLVTGPDGNLWVAQTKPPQLARVTPEPPGSGLGGGGAGAAGPTGAASPTTAAPPATAADLEGPTVSGLRADPRTFVVGRAPTPATGVAVRRKRATTLRYTLSETATAALRIERARAGRRIRGTCRRPAKSGRKGRRCTRYTLAGTLARASHAGANAVPFSGRIGRRKLSVSRYRVTVTATDGAGNATASPPSARFRIVRR